MPDDEDVAYTIVAPHTTEGTQTERAPIGESSLVGRYRIIRRIGKGGMGEVMVAHDEQIGRDVAIKRMRAAVPTERQIQRFLREASVQGRLEHPAIVPVHEIGRDDDGLPFFAMKRLAGNSLAKIIGVDDRVAFPLQRVLRAFAEVCLAVEFAHVRGVIHRDLKPENVILGDFGEVYVLDWGVAKVLGTTGDTVDPDVDFADVGGSGEHATKAGTAIGTPGYMAPEQVRGAADIDGRADIYTLGCMLFEILAGAPLHPSGRLGLASALTGLDARPSQRAPDRAIAPELDAICVAATALDREARIATARELGDRVLEFLDGDRDFALRRGLALQHLARARQAFEVDAREAGADQRVAIREAASALALDPTLEGAAELVGRLMLEPPATTPTEVVEALRADDVRTAKETARAGIWAIAAALAFTPMLWWMAPSASPYLAVFTGFLVVYGGVCLQIDRAPTPHPGIFVIVNTVLVVLVARMFSPVLIAPGVAAVVAMAMVLTPRFSILGSAVTVTVLFAAAILVPWGLERVGVLSTTMSVDRAGILLRAPVVEGQETRTMIVGAIYAVGLIAGASIMANAMRARAREAARRLHLQAWQLRQLVP